MITRCAVCGEHVGRSRLEGFTCWEGPRGEIEGREVIVVVHKECYMRLAPAARHGLLDERSREASRRADGSGQT